MTHREGDPHPVFCKCHSGPLYKGLYVCPACGHKSLDRGPTWEGCERRKCGYEKSLK